MKKLLSVLLCAVMVLSLAACGKKDDAPIDDAGNGGDADGLTVALVVAGKLGDRSFYDSSKEGLDRMVADLGVTPIVIECNNENHDIQMKNAAEKANIVVCVGWEFYNVETIAPDYPEVNWIWVDNATSAPVSNVLNITYAQNEGSFLAGYIAAAVSETGVVGAVGGEDADTINRVGKFQNDLVIVVNEASKPPNVLTTTSDFTIINTKTERDHKWLCQVLGLSNETTNFITSTNSSLICGVFNS